MAEFLWLVSEEDESCSGIRPFESATSSRVLEFGCHRQFRSGMLGAFALRGTVDNPEERLVVPDLLVVYGPAIADVDPETYSQGRHAALSSRLEELGLSSIDADDAAEVALEMRHVNRCVRSVDLFSGENSETVVAVECSVINQLSVVHGKRITIRWGDNLTGLELMALGFDESTDLLFGTPRSAEVDRYQLTSGADLEALLLNKVGLPSELASSWSTGFGDFMDMTSECPRAKGSVVTEDGEPVILQYVSSPPIGWLSGCHLRVESLNRESSQPNQVATISGYRGVGGGSVLLTSQNEMAQAVEEALLAAFVEEAEAMAIVDGFLDFSGNCSDTSDDSTGDADRQFISTCLALYSGVPEVGTVTLQSVVEKGLEVAGLVGAQPTPLSTLWFAEPAYLSLDGGSPTSAVSIHRAPRTVTELFARSAHSSSATTRLVGWGLDREAAEETLARLNATIADSAAEPIPFVLEGQAAVLLVNVGYAPASDEPDLHVIHGLVEGGPELELIVLPSHGEVEDRVELRNASEATIGEALSVTVAEFAAPDGLIADLVGAHVDLLAGAPCTGEEVLRHEAVEGAVHVGCGAVAFGIQRPSLGNTGIIETRFVPPEGAMETEFPIMTVDFIRSGSDESGTDRSADSLVVIHPQYSSPTLPPVLAPVMLLDGRDVLTPLVDELIAWGLSEVEARLIQTTLAGIQDHGCESVESVGIEADERYVEFGCVVGEEEGEFDIAIASLVSEGESEWTGFVANSTQFEFWSLFQSPRAFTDEVQRVAALNPDFSAEMASELADILSGTPRQAVCDEPLRFDVTDERYLSLECTIWDDILNEDENTAPALPTRGVVTQWRIEDGEAVSYFYWIDDPTARGDGMAVDSYFTNLN